MPHIFNNYALAADLLVNGNVGVLKTDTIYGIVARAFNKIAVERIYNIKGRNKNKPFIILISKKDQLEVFDINPNKYLNDFNKYWPGRYSLILPCPSNKFDYLHRGLNSIAFRLPNRKVLTDLIDITGPLVAPSANLQGKPPALNILQAKDYFGDLVDFYVEGGNVTDSKPSNIVDLSTGNLLR